MRKSISYVGANILGPRLSDDVREELEDKNVRYSEFKSSRALLVGLCRALMNNSVPDQVIIDTMVWNLYDDYVFKIATQIGAQISVVSLNPTPIDNNAYNYTITTLDKIKSFKGYTFIVCRNNEDVKYILSNYGSKFVGAGTHIHKQRKINQIVVYGSVEHVTYMEGKPTSVTLVSRPDHHYSFYSTLAKLYIVDEEQPLEDFLYDMRPIQDIVLILAKYIPNKYYPIYEEHYRTQYEFNAIDTLTRLNILHHGNPTYLAFNLSDEIYSNLFLNLWKWDLFPGIVIASFLKYKWSNGGYEDYETSLERNLALWHDLVSELKGDILSDNLTTTLLEGDDLYNMKKIIQEIKRTSKRYGVVLYGQFTVSGAIERALPLLKLIYSDFRVDNVAVLDVRPYTIPLPPLDTINIVALDTPIPVPVIITSNMVPVPVQ